MPAKEENPTARNFCFTDYEIASAEARYKVAALHKHFRYMIWQPETGAKSGRHHMQGYIELTSPITRNQLKELLQNNSLHIETRWGTRDQARIYCTPEHLYNNEKRPPDPPYKLGMKKGDLPQFIRGPYVELGTWIKGQGARRDLQEVAALVLSGAPIQEVASQHPEQFIKYHRGIERLSQVKILPRNGSDETHTTVIWGEAGVGKSRLARELVTDNGASLSDIYYLRDTRNLWFSQGYIGQPVIVIDEFRWNIPFHLLLQLIDRYQFEAETKGGFVEVGCNCFIITSNYPPQKWYTVLDSNGLVSQDLLTPTDRKALYRRLSLVLELTSDSQNPVRTTVLPL